MTSLDAATRAPEATVWPQLVRWPSATLASADLTDSDCAYLAGVGLPKAYRELVAVDPRMNARHHGRLTLCMDAGYVPLTAGADGVLAHEVAHVWRVNSSVRLFGRFLVLYRYHGVATDEGARPAPALARELRAVMQRLDPPAVAGDGWWGVLLEQMEAGML